MTAALLDRDSGTWSSKSLWIVLALSLPVGAVAGTVARGVRLGDIPRAFQLPGLQPRPQARPELEPQTVQIPAHEVRYRPAGSFSLNGAVADAPLLTVSAPVLTVMRHQVSAIDYQECVAAGACRASRKQDRAANLPAVKVSFEDAAVYAAWLSRETGKTYRLPTDGEWIAAAGSKVPQNALLPASASNPATRWLAEYEAEADRDPAETAPNPLGSGGVNEFGVADLAGNVWEWTQSCFVRAALSADGASFRTVSANCGVRVVEGQHRAYLPNFIRDAKGGACSTGKPPSNLGFRLVLERR